jgi:hypothetical protein
MGLSCGCVHDQYYYGIANNCTQQFVPLECATTNRVTFGRRCRRRVDELERVVQAPKRFFKSNFGKWEQEQLSPEQLRVEAVILSQDYLVANGLNDVYIDTRCYKPFVQWRRLRANRRISPFWKYTAGTLDVIGYTLFPRRALHWDVYSPFTNTLSINSTKRSHAIYQAARAKQFRKHHWLGTYAVWQKVPIVPLFHHAHAASDVLTYAHVSDQRDLTYELYPTAYAQVGSAMIPETMIFAPMPASAPPLAAPLIKLASHSTGRMVGRFVADRQQPLRTSEFQPYTDPLPDSDPESDIVP